ncbi:hypothetical protein BRDID11002_66740 [Bradyrhizobium diazoefficiens]
MGDRIGRGAGQEVHFPDRQALAELEQPRLGQNVLAGLALAQEVDVEIVVTASPIGPIADRSTTYIAKSASAISVGPDTVPPGRSILSL